MTTKLIVKEFVFKPSENFGPGLVERTLPGTWPSFLNTYGVWPNYSGNVESHILNFSWTPVKGGVYTFTATCDNSFRWELAHAMVNFGPPTLAQFITRGSNQTYQPKSWWPGVVTTARNQQNSEAYSQVLGGDSWQTVYSTVPRTNVAGGGLYGTSATYVTSEFISGNDGQGPVRMRFHVRNDGGPAAIAATITNSDGVVEWHTRQGYTDNSTGRYLNTSFPFDCSVTVHAWGAGGGAGGSDGRTNGGAGASGSYNTTTFSVERGDTLEVCVGQGGRGGVGSQGGAPGGTAGKSRTNFDSDSTKSFNGGQGGSAGSVPSSGGGGGGGGASVVIHNNVIKCVAFGGGGGGGAGNDGNSASNIERRTATATYNATGVAGTDYRGENGQSKSGDGGGGGAGGGGYPGGQGSAVFSGDASGYAGQSGGNFPTNTYSTGSGSIYYASGFGTGATGNSEFGANGRVVLEITPLSLMSVKDSGEWKQISNAYTKVGGAWKDINTVYIKVDGVWKEVDGSGQFGGDFGLTATTTNYGLVTRSFNPTDGG